MLWIKRCRMLVIVTSVRINGSTVFWVCRVSMPTIAIFFKYGSCFNGNIIDLATKTMTKNYEHTEAHISLSLWLDIRPQNAWNCKSIVAGCCWITSKANVLLCSVHSLDEHKSEQIRIIQLQMTFPLIAQTKTPREMWSERERESEFIIKHRSIYKRSCLKSTVLQNMFALWLWSKMHIELNAIITIVWWSITFNLE